MPDELFPYIRRALPSFLEKNIGNPEVQKLIHGTGARVDPSHPPDLRELAQKDIAKGATGTSYVKRITINAVPRN